MGVWEMSNEIEESQVGNWYSAHEKVLSKTNPLILADGAEWRMLTRGAHC